METYRRCVYMVLDALKIDSDDSRWEVDHIIFMLEKYRALLMKQRYSHYRVDVPIPYFQILNIDLERQGDYLISTKTLPSILNLNGIELETSLVSSELDLIFHLITIDRFKYVGYNKYLKNQIYCTIDYDGKLKIKWNDTLEGLSQIQYNTLLEHPVEIIDFTNSDTNPLDLDFPVEEAVINDIVGMCIKELASYNYLPTNNTNDAADDTPTSPTVKVK